MTIAQRYGELFQLSYITRDLDAAMAHARDALGATRFDSVSEPEVEVLSFGEMKPLRLKVAMANVGRHQIEIIEPISGAIGVYTDEVDLDAHILNFHHIAIIVRGPFENWLALLDEVRASGDAFAFLAPVEPSPDDLVCFCYVDTRKRLGHYTEYLWVSPDAGPMASVPDFDA